MTQITWSTDQRVIVRVKIRHFFTKCFVSQRTKFEFICVLTYMHQVSPHLNILKLYFLTNGALNGKLPFCIFGLFCHVDCSLIYLQLILLKFTQVYSNLLLIVFVHNHLLIIQVQVCLKNVQTRFSRERSLVNMPKNVLYF